jgi:hypothetical protein
MTPAEKDTLRHQLEEAASKMVEPLGFQRLPHYESEWEEGYERGLVTIRPDGFCSEELADVTKKAEEYGFTVVSWSVKGYGYPELRLFLIVEPL